MKILLYTDPHFCQFSSILRKNGVKYSARLENEIQSISWAEAFADTCNCDAIICLGDFFDASDLNCQELSAVREITWSNKPHYMLVGNHELGRNDLEFNSANLFDIIPQMKVISKPTVLPIDNANIYFLPYILEDYRKPLTEYFQFDRSKNCIIMSHNDIKGIQMGQFLSKAGFDIKEIEDNCDLFLNGHLHNGAKITNKIINLGNLTGQNFSEDALKYDHCAFVLDTNTLKVACYENPYALQFYKLDLTIDKKIPTLKNNAVVTVKCKLSQSAEIKEWLNSCKEIIESRVLVEPEVLATTVCEEMHEQLTVDHIKRFNEFVIQTLGNSELILQELMEVSK